MATFFAKYTAYLWKGAVVKDKHIKMEPRSYAGLLFVSDLDGECTFIKNITL